MHLSPTAGKKQTRTTEGQDYAGITANRIIQVPGRPRTLPAMDRASRERPSNSLYPFLGTRNEA